MGALSEGMVLRQLQQAQKETNARMDQLIQQQAHTNAWLAKIAELMETQQRPAPAQPVVYGGQPGYRPHS